MKLFKFSKLTVVAIIVGSLAFFMIGGWLIYKIDNINAFIWLPDYVFNSPALDDEENITDIIFLVVDHWEPGGNIDIVNTWMQQYRKLADRHIDSDGIKLQHTWYYPLDQFRGFEVDSLVQLCREGYGDVEVHLHHKDDNSESFRMKMKNGIDSLQAHGALISEDGDVRFSFVHGNWALDNSRLTGGRNFCGVNDEISILLELGCYADLTFPSLNQVSQPSTVNKIYYAKDDPRKPKSYDKGVRSRVGLPPLPDQLMLIEGPLVIDWSDWRFKTHPVIEDGNLYWEIPTTFHRFEIWMRAYVHVEGRPEWVFVRPFTHGAYIDSDEALSNILGENIDRMLTEVEEKYNNKNNYRLHYMTAREAYNVIKAAEQGLKGNPHDYRDFIIKDYLYN
jgi:hypothetical protein